MIYNNKPVHAPGVDHKDDADRHASAAKKDSINDKRDVEKAKKELELDKILQERVDLRKNAVIEEEKLEKERVAEIKDEFIGNLDDTVYLPSHKSSMVISYKKGNKGFVKGNFVYRTPSMNILQGEEAIMFNHLFG